MMCAVNPVMGILNDGLSNWAEYLAYKLTGKRFKVDNPCSVMPNRLDYFYQYNGKYIGEKFSSKAEIAGGIVLILLGVKILLEHKDGFVQMAKLLLEKEVIFAEDIEKILGPKVKPAEEPEESKTESDE